MLEAVRTAVKLWPMIRILRIAPLKHEMVLNYISDHLLGLPRSC